MATESGHMLVRLEAVICAGICHPEIRGAKGLAQRGRRDYGTARRSRRPENLQSGGERIKIRGVTMGIKKRGKGWTQ